MQRRNAFDLGATVFLGPLVRKAISNPTEVRRTAEDLGHAAGDIIQERTAREIYPREVVKRVSRAFEDLKYEWKKAISR